LVWCRAAAHGSDSAGQPASAPAWRPPPASSQPYPTRARPADRHGGAADTGKNPSRHRERRPGRHLRAL